MSLWEGYFPGDRVTAYRWHIPDPIPFKEALHFEIEHKGSVFTDFAEHLGQFIERPDWISSVAYWYQTPPAVFSERIPPIEKRVAPYRVFKAAELTLPANAFRMTYLILLRLEDMAGYHEALDRVQKEK